MIDSTYFQKKLRRWCAATMLLVTGAVLIVTIVQCGVISCTRTLNAETIVSWSGGGHAFAYHLNFGSPLLGLRVIPDSTGHFTASSLSLRENGHKLGPAHAAHTDIANIGMGRYSHWDSYIVFSASDNSDPRTNGRVYSVHYSYTFPAPSLPLAWGTFVAVACFWIWAMCPLKAGGGQPTRGVSRPGLKNVFCISALLLLAATSQYCLLDAPRPFLLLSSDAGNVASFVAGWLHHSRFASDMVLAHNHNYRFYITVLIPLVMFFDIFTQDLGSAYALLYFPLIFLQLLGFYFLGKYLFRDIWWALVLAILTFPPIGIFGGEMWGVYSEPLVRMSFGAILPFLLLLFIRFAQNSVWLPWLFLFCGVSVYFHSVSAPTVALALWLGAYALKAPSESYIERSRHLVVAGIVFVLAALPFALVFFSGFPSLRPETAAAGLHVSMRAAFAAVIGAQYYSAWAALKAMLLGAGARYAFLWIPGLVAFFLVPQLKPEQRMVCRFFLLFMLGILLGSFGIALADQTASALLHRSPFEIDLIRNMRFLVPVLMLGCVWLMREASERIAYSTMPYPRVIAAAFFGCAVLFAGVIWRDNPTRISGALTNSTASDEQALQVDMDSSAMLSYIRNLPIDSTVLPIDAETIGLAVRYDSLQPVVYLRKDINALMYSGSLDANKWWRDHEIMNSLLTASTPQEAGVRLNEMLNISGPKYLLFDARRLSVAVATAALRSGVVVLRNQHWTLVHVQWHAPDQP